MYDSISEKINLLLKQEGISGMELARKLQMPPSTIKKIRSKEITNPTIATLAQIANYFSVTIEYLLSKSTPYSESQDFVQPALNLPMINWRKIAIQNKSLSINNEQNELANNFALTIEPSKYKIFPLGGTLIIDPNTVANHLDYVIVKRNGYKISIKQFIIEKSEYFLKSIQSQKHIHKIDNYHIIGVVINYIKQLRNKPSFQSSSKINADIIMEI